LNPSSRWEKVDPVGPGDPGRVENGAVLLCEIGMANLFESALLSGIRSRSASSGRAATPARLRHLRATNPILRQRKLKALLPASVSVPCNPQISPRLEQPALATNLDRQRDCNG